MNKLINERTSLYYDLNSSVLKTAELMCGHLEEDNLSENISRLKEIVKKYSDHEETWKMSLQCINSISEDLNAELSDDFDVQECFDEKMSRQKKNKAENTQVFKQFENKMMALLHPEDVDVLETQETISLIDPISKCAMTDPVKNVICNHTYDKKSISSLIRAKGSKKIRCPYQGCSNQIHFKLEDLVPDENTMKAIRLKNESS